MKRIFDLTVAIGLLIALSPLFLILLVLVKITSPGSAIFCTKRVGRNNTLFTMYKFRTMRTDAPQLATHLLQTPGNFLTPVGAFLRKSSLDELPQLWNIIKGEMSLVGPRPALFNQDDLILLRTQCGVHELQPGITGWAQINGRDELAIPDKVALDAEYRQKQSFLFDLHILFRTFTHAIKGAGVSH